MKIRPLPKSKLHWHHVTLAPLHSQLVLLVIPEKLPKMCVVTSYTQLCSHALVSILDLVDLQSIELNKANKSWQKLVSSECHFHQMSAWCIFGVGDDGVLKMDQLPLLAKNFCPSLCLCGQCLLRLYNMIQCLVKVCSHSTMAWELPAEGHGLSGTAWKSCFSSHLLELSVPGPLAADSRPPIAATRTCTSTLADANWLNQAGAHAEKYAFFDAGRVLYKPKGTWPSSVQLESCSQHENISRSRSPRRRGLGQTWRLHCHRRRVQVQRRQKSRLHGRSQGRW